MKKVVSKKIFHWFCLSCCSCLPIASSCTSNKPAAVSSDQNKPTNNSSGKNHELFPQGMGEAQNDSPSTKPLVPNSEGSGLETNQPQGSVHDQGMNEQQDEAQTNSPEQTTFPELTGFKNAVGVDTKYSSLESKVAWEQLKDKPDEILSLFQKVNHVNQKYTVTIKHDDLTFTDQVKGEITNLIAVIKLGNQFQEFRFDLTGFKKQVISEELQKQHSEFLSAKTNLDEELTSLFPSFLATVLYYAYNTDSAPHVPVNGSKLDYYEFLNGNSDLLNLRTISINQTLINHLFTYKKEGNYTYKVVGIKFDDLKGTLGLRVRISNTDANNYENPQFEEEFDFSGFRHLDLTHPEANVLGFSLLPTDLKQLVLNSKNIQTLLKQHPNASIGFDYLANSMDSNLVNTIKTELTYKLQKLIRGVINDETNEIYYQSDSDNLTLSNLRAVQGTHGIYPFYTNYPNSNLFDNFSLVVTKSDTSELKNLTLRFNVKLRAFTVSNYTTINDLYSSSNEDLVLPVSSSIHFESAIKSDQA